MRRLTPLQEEALRSLKHDLPIGSAVLSVARSIAKSGMSRVIDFYTVVTVNGTQQTRFLSSRIAKVFPQHKYNPDLRGIRFQGCGYSAGDEIVTTLSEILYNDRYAIVCEKL